MSKKILVPTAIAALSLFVACDNQSALQEENEITPVQEEQSYEGEVIEGEVIDSSTTVIDREAPELEAQREVERGSTDVQYETTRQVTETVQKEQDLPTVKTTTAKLNINEMNVQDFLALGFDKQAAERIVQTREQRGGSFSSVDELSQIQGVSMDALNKVRGDLGVAPRQAQEE